VPLLFSSLIRLRSSFNRGSSVGSTIAEIRAYSLRAAGF
jgi:hypothetical protein